MASKKTKSAVTARQNAAKHGMNVLSAVDYIAVWVGRIVIILWLIPIVSRYLNKTQVAASIMDAQIPGGP